jgi:hypothetical protein
VRSVKLLLFVLLVSPAWAAVALVGTATNGVCGNSGETACPGDPSTLTFAHSTGAGSNLVNVAACTVSGSGSDVMANITGVTYAGVSMHQQAKRDANYDTYLFELVNPTTGSNNFVVTLASQMLEAAGIINCTGATFSGVHQSTPWTISDCTGGGSGTTASCTLGSSGANDMVVATVCNGTSIGSPTGALTRRAFHDNSAGACDSEGLGTAAGNTTSVSWNNNGSDTWQILAGALKEAAAAASSRTPAHGDTF